MSQDTNKITCPNCGEEIDVNEILYHQLDNELKKKYNDQIAKERKELEASEEKIKRDREAIDRDQNNYESRLKDAIKEGLKTESKNLEETIKEQVKEE